MEFIAAVGTDILDDKFHMENITIRRMYQIPIWQIHNLSETSISRMSSLQQLPIQSLPVCKLSHSPGLYHHNHQSGITKTTTATGRFHPRKIIEKQCGAFVCVMTAAGP